MSLERSKFCQIDAAETRRHRAIPAYAVGHPVSRLAPSLDTYRTVCLAPLPEFGWLLEQARDLTIGA